MSTILYDVARTSTYWGGGEGVCRYLMALCLLVQNKGKAPMFITKVKQEVLGLTICSIGEQKLIHGWRVSHEPSLSDHRYILCRIDTPQVLQKEHRNHTDTIRSKFRSELGSKLNYHRFRIEGTYDLDTVVAMPDTSLRDSFTSSCPVHGLG